MARKSKKHKGTKYVVKCGKRTKSYHRKLRAANRAKAKGCRVVKRRR